MFKVRGYIWKEHQWAIREIAQNLNLVKCAKRTCRKTIWQIQNFTKLIVEKFCLLQNHIEDSNISQDPAHDFCRNFETST